MDRAGDGITRTVKFYQPAVTHVFDDVTIIAADSWFELTRAIVGALPARLEAADIERIKRKPPQDMAAYDYVLRSKLLHHVGTKEANEEALDALNKAIEVDPDYAQAYAWKACTLRQSVLRGYAEEPEVASKQRVANAQKALALDENDMECLRILCEINMEQGQLAQAEVYHNRAFKINPNDPRMAAQRGELMTWMGRHAEGIEWVETAMRLDPLGANSFSHLLGRALLGEQRYAEAIKSYMQNGVCLPLTQYKKVSRKSNVAYCSNSGRNLKNYPGKRPNAGSVVTASGASNMKLTFASSIDLHGPAASRKISEERPIVSALPRSDPNTSLRYWKFLLLGSLRHTSFRYKAVPVLPNAALQA